MGLDIKAPENVILKPIITVFGVGGAGGNAVNNMIKSNLNGANFVVTNTDAQALMHSKSTSKIQLGASLTKGLGAGASPDIGRESAIESESEIRSHLEGSNMVFITAGMGGGTGTGASPIIAKLAKELDILTVGVVTKPFLFEGAKRMKAANKGLVELQKHVDTLIVIPNQNLFRIANENTTFQEAFEMADEVLHAGVRGVTDLITSPGLVNLDFADIETVMREKGKAMMGTGESSGEERAIKAAESAIANPLLDQNSMCGASGVLINITGGKDMTLYEVDSAANRIREEVGDSDANIIFGSTFNPELEGVIRVSVVATGIEQGEVDKIKKEENTIEITQEKNTELELNPEIDIEIEEAIDITDNIVVDTDENENDPSLSSSSPYQEYDDKLKTNEAKLQAKLNDLAKQIDLDKIKKTQTSEKVESKKVKKSLFSRLWNSLTASDTTSVENQPLESNSQFTNGNLQESKNIQDIPNFLNKNK